MDNFRLYHRVPASIEGKKLLPLNQLKKPYPEIAARHSKKYTGREELMQRIIPAKSWLWNDVIHFSPVHPGKVVEALVECGFSRKVKSQWFVVDPGRYNFNASNSIIFLHNKTRSSSEEFEAAEFEEYSEQACFKHTEVPLATKQYFKSVISLGGNPLMFGGIPHILHNGALQTENLEVIEISS